MLHSFPMMIANSGLGGGGHIIEGSGLFDGSTGRLVWTPSGAGDSRTKRIFEIHFKLGGLGTQRNFLQAGAAGSDYELISLNASDKISSHGYTSGALRYNYVSTAVLRDPAAYYVLIQERDGNTINHYLFADGLLTDFDTTSAPSSFDGHFGTSVQHYIGRSPFTDGQYFDGYIARIAYYDNQTFTEANHIEITDDGFWQINDASELTFGTNGFLIEGGSAMAAGTDSSGNSNDFSKTGTITATNDSPTNDADDGYGNYSTLESLWGEDSGTTFSEGNTKVVANMGSNTYATNNMYIPKGDTKKIYFEFTASNVPATTSLNIGVGGRTWQQSLTGSNLVVWYRSDGRLQIEGANTAGWGDAWLVNETVGVAIETDGTNMDIWFSNENVWQASGDPAAGGSPAATITQDEDIFMASLLDSNSSNVGGVFNFGATAFDGTIPDGFTTLATQNLPTPAIINPEEHFHSAVVTHDGTSTASTCTFNLDTYEWLAIIKNTTGAAEKWYWINTLHGITEYLSSDSTADYTTDSNVLTVSGTTFTLGSTLGAKDYLVEFHKAGLTADKASNTAGTINTTATSYNATSGFAMHVIPSNSGSAGTVGNPLTSAPEFVIQKAHRVDQFACYHTGLTDATKGMQLNSTTAEQTNTGFWDSTAPTASVISLGTWDASYIKTIFAWHGVEGYSAFGSYEGNGNSDGPFLNMSMDTGMFLMKSIDAARAWMYQHKEFQVNGESNYLLIYATNSLLSTSTREIDMVSTGVKLRGADGNLNHAETNIYCAWGGRALTDGAINQGRAK